MILVVDNYDSFTYNLVQMIAAAGREIRVVRNDEATVGELAKLGAAGIVISPGPGRPEDAGVSMDLVSHGLEIPILGVCLGHQALAAACGAVVERAPRLMHGKVSAVRHHGVGIFGGLPSPFAATRYHSLAVPPAGLPESLEPVAWSADGDDADTLQGIRHRELPYWGVQFHPESIATSAGPDLMRNFLALCATEAPDA